jgi:hypothetical protein
MCDWGEARCLKKVTSSLYGFAKEQDASNKKKKKGVSELPQKKIWFTTSQELQIPFDNLPSNTPQL